MATWPSTLPQRPLRDGYQEQLETVVLRTSMDQGPAKQRKRFTAAVKPYDVSFLMTKTQLETFISFYEDDISYGSIVFDFPEPRTGVVHEFRMDLSKGAPKITPFSSEKLQVSFSVEKMP